jgi:hypothetical protein
MSTQSQEQPGNIVQAILALIGLLSAGGMCFLDGLTSYTGLQAVFSPGSFEWARFWVPLLLAGLTIGFTAFSTEFIEEMFQGKYKGSKPGLFILILVVCITYDFITGFLGMLCLMTGLESSKEAFVRADELQRIMAVALAVIMVMSPFIVGKFFYKVIEDPGIIGRFFKSLGG